MKNWKQNLKGKPMRPIEEIRKEYGHFCARLGEAKYREALAKEEADMIFLKLKELNQEAAKGQKPTAVPDPAPESEAAVPQENQEVTNEAV